MALKESENQMILPIILSYSSEQMYDDQQQQLKINKEFIIHSTSSSVENEMNKSEIDEIWWKFEDGIYLIGIKSSWNGNSFYISKQNPKDFIDIIHNHLNIQITDFTTFHSPPSNFQSEINKLINIQSTQQNTSPTLNDISLKHSDIEITNIDDSDSESYPFHSKSNSPPLVTSKNRRITRSFSKHIQHKQSVEVVRYNGISITSSDIERINEDMLNDTIIEFYMNYLDDTIPSHNCCFLNPFFFTKLEQSIDEALKWIKVDFSNMNFIFIPIHSGNDTCGHWTLYILCCKGITNQILSSKSFLESPCILGLDSLNSKSITSPITKKLRLLLSKLFKTTISSKKMPFHTITVPKQQNDVDCGVYLLYFIDKICRNQPNSIEDLETIFNESDALLFRSTIQNAVEEIQKK
ncbi:Sentrin/sumo-specific protease [Entamoeba marina]